MQITDVKIRKIVNDDRAMKAIVSVTFDDSLALHDIKVIETSKKIFVVMPSKKNPDGTYKDIVHPTKSELRKLINDAVIKAYMEALEDLKNQNV